MTTRVGVVQELIQLVDGYSVAVGEHFERLTPGGTFSIGYMTKLI